MEMYNGKIAVTFAELTSAEGGEAVVSRNTLGCILRRHPELRLSGGGGMGNYVRIDYYGMRESYRRRYEAKYGDPRQTLAKEHLRAELELAIDEAARRYYAEYRYELRGEEKSLGEDVQRQLVINASVLNRMIEVITRRSVLRVNKGVKTPMGELLESAAELYEKLRDAYDHTLPASLERLRSKIAAYKRDRYAALISRKFGNQSSAVVSEEGGEYLIALKRSKIPVYTDAMLFAAYNLRARQEGWREAKSVRTLTEWLGRPENRRLWEDAVYGKLAVQQQRTRKNSTILPSMRDSLWYGDGTKLNLYYRKWVGDEKGGSWKLATKMVYEVIDAYSEVLLGYGICDKEDAAAQYAAYRMALITAGHRPYEVVHDNQGGHKKKEAVEFLEKLPVRVHRTTAPYSGQSKTIESVFGRFQSQILCQSPLYTGANVTAKKASSHVDMEFVSANLHKLPTESELAAVYEEYRNMWNSARHPSTGVSRMEMYLSSANPATPAVTEEDMVELLWWTTEKPVAYTGDGLQVTIDRRKYKFEVHEAPGVYDYDFLDRNLGRRFYVKYDPCDLSSVRLYTLSSTGGLRFERVAVPPLRIHRNIQEQTEGEQAMIRANIEANRQAYIRRQVEAQTIERKHGMSIEQQGYVRPALPGADKRTEDEIARQVHKRTRNLKPRYDRMSAGQRLKELSLELVERREEREEREERDASVEPGGVRYEEPSELRIASKF